MEKIDPGLYLVMLALALLIGPIIIGIIRAFFVPIFRKRRFHLWLLDNNFVEIDKNDSELIATISDIPFFSGERLKMTIRKAYVCKKVWATIRIIDYRTYIIKRSNSTTGIKTYQHGCIISSPEIHLPEMIILPTQKMGRGIIRFGEGLYNMLQGTDQKFNLRFPDDSRFSESFLVSGRDERSIQQLLSPPMRKYLVELRPMNLFFGSEGQSFVFHYGRNIGSDEGARMLKQAEIFMMFINRETGKAVKSIKRSEYLAEPATSRLGRGRGWLFASILSFFAAFLIFFGQIDTLVRLAFAARTENLVKNVPKELTISEHNSLITIRNEFVGQIGANVTRNEVRELWKTLNLIDEDHTLTKDEAVSLQQEMRFAMQSTAADKSE